MEEKKLKHLEFIQNTIIRMNSNSFMIKGWTITLVAALFALAAKDANINYVLISYIVIPIFWGLDGYFLAQERQYRGLYDKVRTINNEGIDFSMDASSYAAGKATWLCSVFSITLIPFYLVSTGTAVGVMFLFKYLS